MVDVNAFHYRRLFKGGLSLTQIAPLFGVSRPHVQRHIIALYEAESPRRTPAAKRRDAARQWQAAKAQNAVARQAMAAARKRS